MNVQVVIVGGGPAGLTAAIYAGRAGLNPIVAVGGFKEGEIPGGQLMITTDVENYPGFPESISGPELMDRLQEQAVKFGAVIIHEFATNFEFGKEHQLYIGDQLYIADAVILANGARARWLGAKDEELYINRGISACATCDGPLPYFRDKDIYVVGGGDSACEEALFLTKFASKVYIVHRRDQLRASKIMAERVLNHEKINILWNTTIEQYIGNKDGNLCEIILQTPIGSHRSVCGGVFMAIGHIPNTSALEGSRIEIDSQGYVVVKDNVLTNIEGVFAAGDNHDKTYRQAITAAGFGAMASITAERWLQNRN